MSIKWITKRLAVSYFQDNKLTEADGKEIPITDLNKRRNGTLGFVCDPDFFLLGWTGISRLFSKNSGQFSSCSSSAITNHAANLNLYTVLPRSHRARAERGNTLKTGFYLFYPNMAEFSLYGENHHESWVSSPAENGGLLASELVQKLADFHHKPRKDCLSIDFGDFLLRPDWFIQHDRWFLYLQSQRRSANFSSLPGWYWVSFLV